MATNIYDQNGQLIPQGSGLYGFAGETQQGATPVAGQLGYRPSDADLQSLIATGWRGGSNPLFDAISGASGGIVDPNKGTIGIDPTVALGGVTNTLSGGIVDTSRGGIGLDPTPVANRIIGSASPISGSLAGGIVGGVGGFMLGGPGGAVVGAGLGSRYGDQVFGTGTGGATGAGGTGGVPTSGPTYYGGTAGGAQSEADRATTRGNLIGDSFQTQGDAALGTSQQYAADQQARGNLIGDAFQNNYGNPNQQAMAGQAGAAQQAGAGYAAQGQESSAQQNIDRLGQIAAGGAGYTAGRAQMQQSDMYGSQAAGAAGQLQGTQSQQMGIGGAAGAQAAQSFGQGNTYGALAGGDQAAAQMARLQQLANGQQGAAYGAGNMGTSGAFLGQAGQDYGTQAGARAAQMGAVGRLQDFYQQGPGPSVAEAQLKQSTDQNMANAISLARSGRGAGDNASAMRQAMFSNAATQQQAGMQAAQLRAQETDAFRGRQLQAMGQEQSTLGNLRGQDQSMYGQNVGAAGQFAGLGYQGLGLGQQGATSARGQDIQSAGQNLQQQAAMTGLGYQGAGLQAQQANTVAGQQLSQQQAYLQQQNAQGALGYQGYGLNAQQQNQARGMDLTAMQAQDQAGLGYAQLGQGYQNMGLQNQLAYAGLANQQYMSADQIAAQERTAGMQADLAYTGLANSQYQSADQLRAQIQNAQLQADTARYGADRGVQVGMAQLDAQKQAAEMAMWSALGAGALKASDIRGKKKIKEEPGLLRQLAGYKGIFGGSDEKEEGEPDARPASARPAETYANPFGPQPGTNEAINNLARIGAVNVPGAQEYAPAGDPAAQLAMQGLNVPNAPVRSDERAKENAFKAGAIFGQQQGQGRGGTDLRPAQGYSYDYKNPQAPGAAPGRHFGPMAQDLEKTPAGKSVVQTGKDGMKSIDTSRLSLVNTSAISEQQRRLDRLEQLAGGQPEVTSDERAKKKKQPRSIY